MTKKRASVSGKGSAIMLGAETAEEPLPAPVSEADAPPPDESEEVDWSAMLEDEASVAGPSAEEEPAEPSAEEKATAPLPSIEYYYPEEEFEIEPEPEPKPLPQPEFEPEAIPVAAEEFPPEADMGEVDWSAMLEDEVATAEPSVEEEVAPSPPHIEYNYPEEEPAVPESELLDIEEPAVSKPSPAPVSPAEPVTPVPAKPERAVAIQPPVSPAAAQPPADVPTAVPRVRIGGLLAGVSLTGAEAPPPGPELEEVKVRERDRPPPKELTEDEEEIVIRRVSQRQRRELYDHISKLYREVPKVLSSSTQEGKREESLLLLSEARDIVIEAPRQFDEAEYKVAQVEAIIANAENVEKWSHYYGNRLIAYLVAWFIALAAGIAIILSGAFSVWFEGLASATTEGITPTTVEPLLFTMMWGGIGGIVGAIYSLWRKIAVFDKQFTIWYILQPISGLVLGGIVHVVVMTGFLSMSVQTAGAGAPTAQESQAVQWFPVLLAVAFGFRQNNFYALLDRVIELIGQPQDSAQQAEESA